MVGEDHPGVGIDRLANPLHPLRQEEKHGAVVVLATGIAAVEHVADRIDGDDVRRLAAKRVRNRWDHLRQTGVIEHQPQLRCGHEVGAGVQQPMGRQADILHTLAQVVVLDLGLQIEHP